MTTWKQIRRAAEKAGLDVQMWEADMHNRLLHDVLVRTKSMDRYMTDATFHAQMEKMLAYILATVFEHDPLSEDLRHRAEDLGAAFRDEIRESQRGPTR